MSAAKLFVGSNGRVAALNADSGEVLWKVELKPGFFKSGYDFVALLETPTRLYAHTYSTVYCLDLESGTIIWENPIKDLTGVAVLSLQGTQSKFAGNYAAWQQIEDPRKKDIQP